MSAGWVAATNRGQALLHRRLGPQGALDLAASASWADARRDLSHTVYGHDLPSDADRTTARRIAATNAVWQLRVLAGWCPPTAGGLARLFAAPIEVRNIEAHLRSSGKASVVPLGSLGVVSQRLTATTSAQDLRSMLTHSSWGDPGGTDLPTIAFGLRVAWLRRLARRFPDSKVLATGALGVLIARERFAFERTIAETTARDLDRQIGPAWRLATSITALADFLPDSAGILRGVDGPDDLWRAEVNVVHLAFRVAGGKPSATSFSEASVARVMALILLDLWRVDAAIETAGRGTPPAGVFDAVA